MTPHAQLPMFQVDSASSKDVAVDEDAVNTLWFGLAIDHWELFDALEVEWLRPAEGLSGRILPVRAFPVIEAAALRKNRIVTYIKVDPARLPALDVHVFRGGSWRIVPITDVRNADDAIFWPGALPMTAIASLVVSNLEEQGRLVRLAQQASNLPFSSAPGLRSNERDWKRNEVRAPEEVIAGITLPDDYDAIRGATTMAVWAVPPIDPWLDLLASTLTLPLPELSAFTKVVGASWWSFPPWIRVPVSQWPSDVHCRLWLAAIEVFRSFDPERGRSGEEIVQGIAGRVVESNGADADIITTWASETLRILRADAVINLGDWKINPVGKAIQLVLVRPEPTHFKTWAEDLPDVSPAVWWSAAVLCGLLQGYRRLDVSFRGGLSQRRFLANHALASLAPQWTERFFQGSMPTWHRSAEQFVFVLGSERLWEKPQRARAKWFDADLSKDSVQQEAKELARRLGWLSCFRDELHLSNTTLPISGPGSLSVNGETGRILRAEGTVVLQLSTAVRLVRAFDATMFRACMATESGAHLPMPPQLEVSGYVSQARGPKMVRDNKPLELSAQPRDVLPSDPEHVEIPGLRYVQSFMNEEQETRLVATIDALPWLDELSRRVQHYGWRYDYKKQAIDRSMRLGPLPDWAQELADRLATMGLVPHTADQVIVNEYIENQGITKHIDCVPCFNDGIAMISLLESWEMIFREERGAKRKCAQLLERRSVAVMSKDARYKWTHEIPQRKREPNGLVRGRRISVTFRKVNESRL